MVTSLRFPVLVFDFDGTLVDSVREIAAALAKVLEEAGRPALPEDAVRLLVGDGARNLVELGFRATGQALDAAGLDRWVARFVTHYDAVAGRETRLYPGVVETLDRLAGSGHRFGLCTNKLERSTRLLLDGLGIAGYFGAVVGGDSLAVKKPHKEPLLHILRALDAAPDEAVMIGDNEHDMATARAAGVPGIAVSYGYSRVPIAELGAAAVIDRFDALPGALERLAVTALAAS